jgi:hypothetical protein
MNSKHVAVMIKDGKVCVLKGLKAEHCLNDFTALSHHLCGLARSQIVVQILNSVEDHLHHRHAYNFIFDKHWEDQDQ